MKFKQRLRPKLNIDKYPKNEYDIAYKFAERMYEEFANFIRCIALFGSSVRKGVVKGDIDVLVVVDDLMIYMDQEVAEAYRIITEKIVREVSTKLHITSLKLTSFWEYVRAGDPVAINMLRDGAVLIDTGFFEPLQVLLKQGRIRPSAEAIWVYYSRAPATLHNSKWHLLQATLDLYWAVIDAAHATLMKLGETPPTPEHVADILHDKLVARNLLEKKYVDIMRNFYRISKNIVHRELKEVTGDQYEAYYKDAKEFVSRMKEFVEME